MSSGLVYVPGQFADLGELLALGQELRRVDGIYVSHICDESDHLVDAVDETIAIGERNGIRAQVSHLKITARRNAGRIGAAIQRLHGARARGVRVHADVYRDQRVGLGQPAGGERWLAQYSGHDRAKSFAPRGGGPQDFGPGI